jgi:hypothetical protein
MSGSAWVTVDQSPAQWNFYSNDANDAGIYTITQTVTLDDSIGGVLQNTASSATFTI